MRKVAGIYVHFPFCRRKCAYCDFYSIARPELADAFAEAAVRELEARMPELGGLPVATVYFGGGTPSSVSPEVLEHIVSAIPIDGVEEFTIEVNPDDVTADAAAFWASLGINRVSMGVQSLVDTELLAVGRRHTAAQALEAVDTLRSAGFSNISLDLIYGLPGQTVESWEHSVRGILATGVTHLSAYLLSYEPGTLLTRRLNRGLIKEASDDTVLEMYGRLCRLTAEAGFEHYEISNFAAPGMHSRHNSSYWNLTPYLGIGPAAHSLGADGVRRFHTPDIKEYIANPADVETDEESEEELLDDLIIISLRRRQGLNLADVPPKYAQKLMAAARNDLESGRLLINSGVLTIPEHHWLEADAVIRNLLFG